MSSRRCGILESSCVATYAITVSSVLSLTEEVILICVQPLMDAFPPSPTTFTCFGSFRNRKRCIASDVIKFICEPESNNARNGTRLPFPSVVMTVMVANNAACACDCHCSVFVAAATLGRAAASHNNPLCFTLQTRHGPKVHLLGWHFGFKQFAQTFKC